MELLTVFFTSIITCEALLALECVTYLNLGHQIQVEINMWSLSFPFVVNGQCCKLCWQRGGALLTRATPGHAVLASDEWAKVQDTRKRVGSEVVCSLQKTVISVTQCNKAIQSVFLAAFFILTVFSGFPCWFWIVAVRVAQMWPHHSASYFKFLRLVCFVTGEQ